MADIRTARTGKMGRLATTLTIAFALLASSTAGATLTNNDVLGAPNTMHPYDETLADTGILVFGRGSTNDIPGHPPFADIMIGIGTKSPGYRLDVNGALRLDPSTQPTGANGVVYYDSTTNKFRCFQNSAWIDCMGGGTGTVTNVGTGTGLAGGPITTTGTITLQSCPASQILKSTTASPIAWACAADANSGGTVTSVATGAGLAGGTITSSGTLTLQSCPAGQLLKSTTATPIAWACATDTDTNSGGTVTSVATGTGLAGGTITSSGTLTLQSCAAGQVLKSTTATPIAWACAADANSGGSVTSVATGAGLAGGTITSSGTLTLQSCAVGQVLKSTSASPIGWGCAADAGGTGTVTSVTAGAGLTSSPNPITTTGTISLAAPTSSVLGGVLAGACGYGMEVTGIATNGAAICTVDDSWAWRTTPRSHVATTIDTVGSLDPDAVFTATSMTIGADGLPVVAYYDASPSPQSVKLLRCGNPLCNAGNTLTTIDGSAGNEVGQSPSVAIGTDGFPVVAYYDITNTNLRVAKCHTASCAGTPAPTITTVDSAGDVGKFTSIAIGTDGFPIIAYYNVTGGGLKIAHCTTTSCSASGITTLDLTSNVGRFPSIAIGTDGFAIVSYYDVTNADLKVAHCTNVACTAAGIVTLDGGASSGGRYSSIAIGSDGLPVISYRNDDVNSLKVAHCGNVACSLGNSLIQVTAVANSGTWSSIAIGPDGYPLISFWQAAPGALAVAHCGNVACTLSNIAVIDSAGTGPGRGSFTSIAIGPADSLGVISYYDSVAQTMKVAHLANEFGIGNFWRRG